MNILEAEDPLKIEARTSKYQRKTNIIYSIVEFYHNLCIDKQQLLYAQIKACENLSRQTTDLNDISAIHTEIVKLKRALALLK